jgi:hypothetical protein
MSYDEHLIDSLDSVVEQQLLQHNTNEGYATSLKFYDKSAYDKSAKQSPYNYAQQTAPYENFDLNRSVEGSLFGADDDPLLVSAEDIDNSDIIDNASAAVEIVVNAGGADNYSYEFQPSIKSTTATASTSSAPAAPRTQLSVAAAAATATATATTSQTAVQQAPMLQHQPSVNWTSDLISILDDGIVGALGAPQQDRAELPVEQLISQCRQFSNLANNFLSVAVGYAKVIISEVGLSKSTNATLNFASSLKRLNAINRR